MFKTRFISMLVLLAAVVTGAWAETIDLSTLTADYEAQNGDVLTGTLAANVKITIADGATVTLSGAVINGTNSSNWAGLTLAGDGTIILSGENTVKGFYEDYPGIFVPANKTLTIQGDGSLTASSNGWAAGIGGGYETIACGNITIEGGTINAQGGSDAAGIGGGYNTSCGNISITGGTVTATGGRFSAGIGSGNGDSSCGNSCGNITISDGVTKVTATAGQSAPNSIGAGYGGTCGTVTIGGTVYPDGISTSPFTYEGNSTVASTYTVTLKEGTEDATNWTITPAEATTTGVAQGTEVTATYSGAKKVKSVKAVKKAAVPVTAITLNKTETSIMVGATETLSVTAVAPDNATDKTYTWKTSDETKATVDQDGKVTAVAGGTVTIYAEANDGSGVKGNCSVTVTPATITVTWNNDDITGTDTFGTSFTKDGVTITAGMIDFDDKNFSDGGEFTTTLGNFTKIEVVTDGECGASGTGWSGNNKEKTWTGNASSSVSFSGNISAMGMGINFVFTIVPTN